MNSSLPDQNFYSRIEKIYDTHAALMYGCIYRIVKDKQQAENILSSIFQDFYTNNPSNVQAITAPIWFIKYALKSTFIYRKNIPSNKEDFSTFKKLFCNRQIDVKSGNLA